MRIRIIQEIIDKIRKKEQKDVSFDFSQNKWEFIDFLTEENVKLSSEIYNDDYIKVNGLIFENSGKQTKLVIDETIIKQNYAFYDLKNDYVVFDLGANIGTSALYFANLNNVKKVYAFEPLVPTYNILSNNLNLNSKYSHKIKCFNFGLGNEEKQLKVKYNIDSAASVGSTGMFDSCFENKSTELIEIRQASKEILPLMENSENVKFMLKIDVEGAEYEILPDLYLNGVLEKFSIIQLEFHKDPLPLLDILEKAGFLCLYNYSRTDDYTLGFIKAIK